MEAEGEKTSHKEILNEQIATKLHPRSVILKLFFLHGTKSKLPISEL